MEFRYQFRRHWVTLTQCLGQVGGHNMCLYTFQTPFGAVTTHLVEQGRREAHQLILNNL